MAGQTPQQLSAQAVAHHQAGRLGDAEAFYRRVLWSGVEDKALLAETHYNLAVLLRGQGRLDPAVEQYRRAAELRPDHARTYNGLGAVLGALGRLEAAEESLRHAVSLQPGYANARYNLGNVLKAQGRMEAAAAAYMEALAVKPDDPDVEGHLAVALQALGRLDQAEAHFLRALALRPGHAPTHDELGVLLLAMGRPRQAMEQHAIAVRLDPGLVEAHYHLGVLLEQAGREDEAAARYHRAVVADPEHAASLNNLGQIRMAQGRSDEALELLEAAVEVRPDFAEAQWRLALVRLLKGRFETGWAGYEWRLKLESAPKRRFAKPLWDGGGLAGRTILLHAEGSLGDTLQFMRYAALVKALGAAVIVESPPELIRLLRTAEGIDHLSARGGALPPFDVQAPLPSLPGLFGTDLASVPSRVPYLGGEPALIEDWRRRLGRLSGLKVGLVWRGELGGVSSIPAEALAGLSDLADVNLVNLQIDADSGELAAFAKIEDCSPGLTDWAETAALIASLDVVLCVDSALAHLAGALAAKTFVLLAHAADWRWLEGRADSPWYPTATLFRQPASGDWASVLGQVRDALTVLT